MYAVSPGERKLKRSFSEYIKQNIVITTSGRYKPETLVCAIGAMGIDRVLFAIDCPFVAIKDAVQQIGDADLRDSGKGKIYHINAEKWLKL
jgi:2,3-dihydroxybenzoate decarboxylase